MLLLDWKEVMKLYTRPGILAGCYLTGMLNFLEEQIHR